jgi:hypothetical protein
MKRVLPLVALATFALCALPVPAAQRCDPTDFTIESCELPPGIVGKNYSATVASLGCDIFDVGGGGAGGIAGCSVMWTAVGLPNGIMISPQGEATIVSGIPTEAGSYPVTFTATDMHALGGMGCETTCQTTLLISTDISQVPPEYSEMGEGMPGGKSDNHCLITAVSLGSGGGTALAGLAVLAALSAMRRIRSRS